MKRVNIQLQPARSPRLDMRAAAESLRGLQDGSTLSQGEDAGRPYVNIGFEAPDPAKLWAAIREQLRAYPELAAAAIVVCQGEHSWDEYLLLHHFDPCQALDALA
jgi:hypothetical protein